MSEAERWVRIILFAATSQVTIFWPRTWGSALAVGLLACLIFFEPLYRPSEATRDE